MTKDLSAEDARSITGRSSERLIANLNHLVFDAAQQGYRFVTWFYSYDHDDAVDQELVRHFEGRGFTVSGTVKGEKLFGSRFYLKLSW